MYTIYTGGATAIATTCGRRGIQHCLLNLNYSDSTVMKSCV